MACCVDRSSHLNGHGSREDSIQTPEYRPLVHRDVDVASAVSDGEGSAHPCGTGGNSVCEAERDEALHVLDVARPDCDGRVFQPHVQPGGTDQSAS